jgi:hypothetical protein
MMHLTSEQMESALSGQPAEETARHLGDCARCVGELAALREVFGNLREATAVSAEHHRRFVSTVRARRVPRMAWALATAMLFVAVGAPLAVHHRGVTSVVPGNVTTGPGATISDEALLDGVQNDLSTSVPASMLPLAGTSTSTTDSAADSTAAQRKNP